MVKKLKEIICFLMDMDGTFYLGNRLIDGAQKFLQKIERQNKKLIFLTNNSSKSSRDYQQKLEGLGVSVPPENIINSGEVTADYIKERKEGARVYLVGTPSLQDELEAAGLQVTTDKEGKIDYLVLGFDTTLTYKKLWDAHDLIIDGIPYLATNPDYVCPLEDKKTMPDCGSIISLLKTSTGKEPLVIGKPNTLMVDYVARKTGIDKKRIAMVGDKLYTDIQTAVNAKITGILVLSGETSREDLKSAPQKPDYIFPSIKELGEAL